MSMNKLCSLWSMRNFYDYSSLDHSGLKVLEIPAGPYSGLREAAHSLRPEPSACQVAPAKGRLFGRLPPGLLVWPPRPQLAPPFPFTGETNMFRVRGIKPLYKTLVCRRKASHCFRECAHHRAWLPKRFSKWNTQEPNLRHTKTNPVIKKGLWNILRAKLMWKIHNKQNIKIINKNKISIIISLLIKAFSV